MSSNREAVKACLKPILDTYFRPDPPPVWIPFVASDFAGYGNRWVNEPQPNQWVFLKSKGRNGVVYYLHVKEGLFLRLGQKTPAPIDKLTYSHWTPAPEPIHRGLLMRRRLAKKITKE